MAPVGCWVSLVLCWCLSTRQHPMPISTPACRGDGQSQPPLHLMKTERKAPQHSPNPLLQRPPTHCRSFIAYEPAAVPGSELPACTCNIYQPWFSPYSYFMSAKGATQQHLDSLSSSQATSTQEHQEESDDLSEIVCFSFGSSDEPQAPRWDRLTTGRASITVQDIITVSDWQPEPQHGYKCLSCCHIFPTLWSTKTHIHHSSQEDYSCKVYYCRLKALWEKGKAQEAAAPWVPMQPHQPGSRRGRALLHHS